MKLKNIMQIFLLFAMLLSIDPEKAEALVPPAAPPVDMFQLPWELGLSWVPYDGFDNGTRRPITSPHYYLNGGAVDFAPHAGMVVGEDTSNYWVAAAAAGVVTTVSSCHIVIDHGNGWTTEYWHLANIQVKTSDVVARNQKLAVIADNISVQVCTGNEHPGPHLHFVMRPSMKDTKFAGWTINFDPKTNVTTYTKNGQTVNKYEPLLNVMSTTGTSTPTNTPVSSNTPTSTSTTPPTNTSTPTNTVVATNSPTPTATSIITTDTPTITTTPAITDTPTIPVGTATFTNTPVFTNTPTATGTVLPTGPYVLTDVTQSNLFVGQSSPATVSLLNVPVEGYVSAEFTCTYDANLLSVSNITLAGLFGPNPVVAINGPQNGSFILAMVAINGNKATTSGPVFTFDVTALQAGQAPVQCTARVSKGQSIYETIAFVGDIVNIQGFVTPTSATATNPGPLPPLLTGQVHATKPVTISLYNLDSTLAAAIPANPDGTFNLNAAAGSYTVVASAEGYLKAQAPITLTNGVTTTMPTIDLIAGDVDGNGAINQLDALTIGMNYNGSIPTAADLNNDGVINVLDLQMLAAHYGLSGAIVWQ